MNELDTERLLQRAKGGDSAASQALLTRYHGRLQRMVNAFLDPRLSARIDPSDVIQEAMTRAATQMPQYLQRQPIAFYPWLRQMVRDELIRLHRFHVVAERRSVRREKPWGGEVSDASAMQLADYLVSPESSPSQKVTLIEMKQQVKAALAKLAEADRELLLMRCVEQLSIREIQEVLGISETAAKSRLRRAVQRLGIAMKRS